MLSPACHCGYFFITRANKAESRKVVQPGMQPRVGTTVKPRFIDQCKLANERKDGNVSHAHALTQQPAMRLQAPFQLLQELLTPGTVRAGRLLRITVGILVVIEVLLE